MFFFFSEKEGMDSLVASCCFEVVAKSFLVVS